MKKIMQPFHIIFAIIFTAGCNNKTNSFTQKTCIENVMRIDDSLATIRNNTPETNTLSLAISNYVIGMKKMDFSDCPHGFKEAFEKHGDAWTGFLALSDKYKDARGEMHVLFERIEKGEDSVEFKTLSGKIWSTWADIEKIRSAANDVEQ